MGGKSSPPAAPDPYATAGAQAQYSKDTALFNAGLNRYNTYTPFGSQTWSQSGTDANGVPQYTQNISLTPDAEQAFKNTQQTQAGLSDLQRQALGGVQSTLDRNPFDPSQLPARTINPGQTAQDAIMSRLQPEIDLQNKQFEADMANRGIAQGSDPYNAARRAVSQQQNDLTSQAALQGIDVGQQARQQAIQEQGYYANAPLNYLNALMTGSQVQTPQFQGTPASSATTPNFEQAVANNYQGQLNAYNAQTGQQNSMTTGLMGLAATAAMVF